MSFRAAFNAHISKLFLAHKQELPRVFLIVLGSILVLAFTQETYGHCTLSHPGHCVSEPMENIGKAGENATKGTGKTLEKAGQVAAKTPEKDVKDVESESVNGYGNMVEAFAATGKFVERQIHSASDSISAAEKRIREGKVIDAFWHLGAEDFRYSEENAAKATQESSLINTVRKVSASVYGGPAGAAAYAAWYTYRATGDFEMSLRVGIIVGATRTANASMPTEKLFQKALISGAIGGVAVAASGGYENAVVEGFLKSGGMVLVQDGYKEYTEIDPDALHSIGDGYCMLANPEVSVDPSQPNSCLPPVDAYARDANGNVLDEDGNIWSRESGKSPDIDVRKTDYRRNHIENRDYLKDTRWYRERGSFMTTVSNVPGMNAMVGFHDHWAVSWNMSALSNKVIIVPAVVLTYMGTTAPLEKVNFNEDIKKQNEQNTDISNTPVNSVPDNSNSLAVAKQLKIPGIYGVKGNGGVRVADHSCVNKGVIRNIAVDIGGESTNYACRVIYESGKGTSVPWIARIDPDYCGSKAASMLSKFSNWGWSCVSRELSIDDGHTVTTDSTAPFEQNDKVSMVQNDKISAVQNDNKSDVQNSKISVVQNDNKSDVQNSKVSVLQNGDESDVQKTRISDLPRPISRVYKCFQGSFSRTIYVELGNSNDAFTCRVVYKSENETSIPWTAKNDQGYCSPVAGALAVKFENYGWNCQ